MPLRNKAVANRFHLVQVLKMYNKMLEPLLENEPNKVITSAGIWIRQKCYPLFCHVLRRKTKRAFVLVSRESIPEDEPVIFVSTHEFREDAEAAYLAAGRAAYAVNGSVSTVMNSFLGIENWAVGVISGLLPGVYYVAQSTGCHGACKRASFHSEMGAYGIACDRQKKRFFERKSIGYILGKAHKQPDGRGSVL